MADKIAELVVEIGANIDDFTRGMNETKTGLTGVGEFALKAFAGIAAGVLVAQKAVEGIKQVLEFGAEGAEVLNVKSAFDSLMTTVGEGPGIMSELKAATQGTVTELDLMAGSTKLLTGTTGDLQQALSDNLSSIWAIANAMSDMNPELGTAADMFDKITTAIKSGRTQTLAQVGLTVDAAAAYREYALSVGKTTGELTKEEKQIAILTGVLKNGNTVVQQAANVNDEHADSIARAQTAMENLANAAKARFAPAIARFAEGLTVAIEGFDGVATGARAALAATQELDGGLSGLGDGLPEMTETVWDAERAWAAYGERLQGLAGAHAEYLAGMQQWIEETALQAGLQGTVQAAFEEYQLTIGELTTQHGELTESLVDLQERGISPTAQAYQELQDSLAENEAAQLKAIENFRETTAEMLMQQVQSKLTGEASLELGRALGLVSQADYDLSKIAGQLTLDLDANANGMIDAGLEASNFAGAMANVVTAASNLAKQNLPITAENIAKELENMASTNADATLEDTGSAASEASGPVDNFAAAADAAASAAEGAAGATDNQNDALDDVKNAASNAKGGVDSLRPSVSAITPVLQAAAAAAGNLAAALRSIPRSTNVQVKTTGIDAAIADLYALTRAANAVPRQITINAKVVSSTVGMAWGGPVVAGAPYMVGEVGPELFVPSSNGMIVPNYALEKIANMGGGADYTGGAGVEPVVITNTYNIYNPLAAEMAMDEQRQEIEARVMRRMA